MYVLATDKNSAATVLGYVLKMEDSAHGSELFTVEPWDTQIPAILDTFHYDIEELADDEYRTIVSWKTEDAIWEADRAARRERQIILDKRDGLIG